MIPFNCSSFAYVFSSTLIRVDLASGTDTDLGPFTPASSYNAVGYNSLDGYMYGYNPTTNRVSKLGGDLTAQDLAAIPNLPPTAYNIGDIQDGYLYLTVGASLTYYVIDVNPSRATFQNLVNPSTKALTTTGTSITGATVSGTAIGAGDWAFNPQDNQLYYIRNADGIVRRMNPSTGVVTALTTINPPPSGQFGSLFFGPSGDLYAIENLLGNVYKFAISGTTATRSTFSTLGALNGGDGARCANAPIFFATLEDPPIKNATSYVKLDDEILYTIIVKNIGNTPAENVVFSDTIPPQTSFVDNSFSFNNVNITGSPLPPSGIEIGTVPIGTSTITFKVKATTLPSSNPVSNSGTFNYSFTDTSTGTSYNKSANTSFALTTILSVTLTSTKFVDKAYANTNEILTYTISINSVGNTQTSTIRFIDSIPIGSTFISNSLTQDGVSFSGNPSPPGVILPNNLQADSVTTLSFKVLVVSVPTPNPLENISTINYSFTVNPTIPTSHTHIISTNKVLTTIVDNSISLFKEVDKAFSLCNDTLTYSITVTNTGNTLLKNLIFYDTIPPNTTFISGSVTIDNLSEPSLNPEVGLPLADLPPSSSITITFKVLTSCI